MRPPPAGLVAVMPLLTCPYCSKSLELLPTGAAGCSQGHSFDLARHGYLSLLGRRARTDTADSADMVAARAEFLAAAHYRPIAKAIAEATRQGPVLEIGAGTGYYLATALDRLTRTSADPGPDAVAVAGLALDSSRFAARRAALAHPGIGAIVADAWAVLPVRDAAVATVLSVFAPRDPAEVARVLAPGGVVVVVTPEPEHLGELRGRFGMLTVDAGKSERLVQAFAGRLSVVGRRSVSSGMTLTRQDISCLVRMGPSARHIRPDDLAAAIGGLADRTTVTLSVTVSVLRADQQPGPGRSR